MFVVRVPICIYTCSCPEHIQVSVYTHVTRQTTYSYIHMLMARTPTWICIDTCSWPEHLSVYIYMKLARASLCICTCH